SVFSRLVPFMIANCHVPLSSFQLYTSTPLNRGFGSRFGSSARAAGGRTRRTAKGRRSANRITVLRGERGRSSRGGRPLRERLLWSSGSDTSNSSRYLFGATPALGESRPPEKRITSRATPAGSTSPGRPPRGGNSACRRGPLPTALREPNRDRRRRPSRR